MKALLYFVGGVKVDFDGRGVYMEMPHDYRMEMEFEALPRKGDFVCFRDGDCRSAVNNLESFEVTKVTFYAAVSGPSIIQIILTPENQ
jgi:hypothetical protein